MEVVYLLTAEIPSEFHCAQITTFHIQHVVCNLIKNNQSMSNISSNSLFHFTPEFKYLIDIFKRGFQPRYCQENIKLNDHRSFRGFNTGVPMTCFCDISLSQISNHIQTYGNYGIGMKKEWGIKNRLNPIIYLNKNSFVSDPLSIIGENGLKLNDFKNGDVRKIGEEIILGCISLLMYSKPYSGDFTHNGKTNKDVKFYNEREWRYIPIGGEKSAPFRTLSEKQMDNNKELQIENEMLKSYQLHFNPNDVKYIFVKEESEIHKIVSDLRKIKSPNYDRRTIDILTSKILTTEQILEDF